MKLHTLERIQKLTAASGSSGFEGGAAQVAAELLRPLVDEVSIDKMGNVLGVRRCGKENAKKLLLDAHLDEVGLMVMGCKDGFLSFTTLGGIDPRILPNREVTVLTEPPMMGIVTAPVTETKPEEGIPMEAMRIDVGLSQAEACAQIPIGTPVVFREQAFSLGRRQIAGKALDDRSCFFILLKTLERLREQELDVDLYVLGSCCEETDGGGAAVSTYGACPDYAVAVDVTFGNTTDGPKGKGFDLGTGAAIGVGPNIAWWMAQRFQDKAKALDMPYHLEVMAGNTGTNGWEMQVSREGVATAILSLPLKYMHTPLEVVHRRDIRYCVRLLAAFVEQLGEEAPA